jgi:hypothetical protein
MSDYTRVVTRDLTHRSQWKVSHQRNKFVATGVVSSNVKLIGRPVVGPTTRYPLLKNSVWFGEAQEDTVY